MDIRFSAEEQAFRLEVRAFLHAELPERLATRTREGKALGKDDLLFWMRKLNQRGWLAPGWPQEHGGTGWGVVHKQIFEEECFAAGAPRPIPFGLNMVAPVLMKFGTPEQKAHYLPRILNCDDWWCQGYSEPGSGSDLASLKTRAMRDGDHYVVTGQKTWTTLAQHADWMFCLVRTDPDVQAQRGISFLLIDMKTPGITVRPIITLDGEHTVNEVFLDNVKVPVTNLVGRENEGWTCAKYLLTFERTAIARTGESRALLARLKAVASRERRNGRPLIDDPLFRAQIAEVEIRLMANQMSNLRLLATVRDGGVPGAESSMLKIASTELRQSISYLLGKAQGSYALPQFEDALHGEELEPWLAGCSSTLNAYLDARKSSIYGGTNEIQKNIIAKMILEL
jgi:alkylation response protein AidB-like acyl-CoA dehydrogenase